MPRVKVWSLICPLSRLLAFPFLVMDVLLCPTACPISALLCSFFRRRSGDHGQDGDSAKTSDSSSTEEKTSESSFAPDSTNHLVALDMKWFVSLHHTLLKARDSLICAADMIEKNMEKLLRPKGTNTQGGGMYAF